MLKFSAQNDDKTSYFHANDLIKIWFKFWTIAVEEHFILEHEKFLGVCLCMNKFKIVSFGVKIMKGEIAQSALHFPPAPVQALSTLSQAAFGAFTARIINPNMIIIF